MLKRAIFIVSACVGLLFPLLSCPTSTADTNTNVGVLQNHGQSKVGIELGPNVGVTGCDRGDGSSCHVLLPLARGCDNRTVPSQSKVTRPPRGNPRPR